MVDGAGLAVADRLAFEAGNGGDVGGGAEDEDFAGGLEGVGGDVGFEAGGEGVVVEEGLSELEGATEGGSGEDASGAREEEAAVGVDDGDVFGWAFGEVVLFVAGEDEVELAVEGFVLHEGVGKVVAGFDGGKVAGFYGDGGPAGGGSVGVGVHEGGGESVDDDVEGGLGAVGGADPHASGAAGEEDADEGVIAAGGADGLEYDVNKVVAVDRRGEMDAGGGLDEAVEVGFEEEDASVAGFEGFEDAVAAMDEVVVDGDDHPLGVGGDASVEAGVHGVEIGVEGVGGVGGPGRWGSGGEEGNRFHGQECSGGGGIGK